MGEVPLGRERTFAVLASGREAERAALFAEHDELCLQRSQGGPFATFKEEPVLFAPTFKLKPAGSVTGLGSNHSLSNSPSRTGFFNTSASTPAHHPAPTSFLLGSSPDNSPGS